MNIDVSELSMEELQELLNNAECELTKREDEDNKVSKISSFITDKFEEILKSKEYHEVLKRDYDIELSEQDIITLAQENNVSKIIEGGFDFNEN